MATIDDGELYLAITGADEAQLRAAIAAARGIIVASDTPVSHAFEARFDREAFDEADDMAALPDAVSDKAAVLDEADAAAARAAGIGSGGGTCAWR